MYGENGVGMEYEIYNFGKTNATIDFVVDTFPRQLKDYGRGCKTIVIAAVGGNNAKAQERPDNFVSTPEEYESEMRELLMMLKQNSDAQILVSSSGYVDETKTNPKINPLTGGKSYFTNARRQQFGKIDKKLCGEIGIQLVGVDIDDKVWLEKYVYEDGLHPNQAGYQLIFESIRPLLDEHLRV